MIKVVIDCETNTSSEVELTADEVAEVLAAESRNNARIAEEAAALAAEEAARESARTKLAALGLTEAEVAALVK
jgi:hypothetical protein